MAQADIIIPADVPSNVHTEFHKNYTAITQNTGHLFLFACDQKIEHMYDNFSPQVAHPDAQSPEHLFRIAKQGRIGAMATHLGLIARYGTQYDTVNYIVKLNGKTNLIKKEQSDPRSSLLYDVDDVIEFKRQSGLAIAGIGLTVYLGSEYEYEMLSQAAQAIFQAHQQGLIAMLWMNLRGKSVTHEQDTHLLAGATGVALALGSDFVKIKAPQGNPEQLKTIATAAGNTKVMCAGGKKRDPEHFLQELYDQIHSGNTHGCAIGRNIFQRSLPEAVAMTNAIAAIVFDNAAIKKALSLLR
jgi:fructose-bisphosphate aldolase/6-deoxy-5-ketofructose 1-phosphate synthase